MNMLSQMESQDGLGLCGLPGLNQGLAQSGLHGPCQWQLHLQKFEGQ
jgi:hypothetical protein